MHMMCLAHMVPVKEVEHGDAEQHQQAENRRQGRPLPTTSTTTTKQQHDSEAVYEKVFNDYTCTRQRYDGHICTYIDGILEGGCLNQCWRPSTQQIMAQRPRDRFFLTETTTTPVWSHVMICML